jgi:outer membrane lipopolysaccharide assembly protein LptE/RlpB
MDARVRITALRCILLVFVLLTAGCGYSVYGRSSLPFTEIQIGRIENRTLEPKLEDKLYEALVEEFARNGISVTAGAASSISGVVSNYTMFSLSEKDDITVEYRIVVDADFTFRDAAGKTREIKTALPFIVSFSGIGSMANLLANRDVAERQAMADIAMEIVGALIYK